MDLVITIAGWWKGIGFMEEGLELVEYKVCNSWIGCGSVVLLFVGLGF